MKTLFPIKRKILKFVYLSFCEVVKFQISKFLACELFKHVHFPILCFRYLSARVGVVGSPFCFRVNFRSLPALPKSLSKKQGLTLAVWMRVCYIRYCWWGRWPTNDGKWTFGLSPLSSYWQIRKKGKKSAPLKSILCVMFPVMSHVETNCCVVVCCDV